MSQTLFGYRIEGGLAVPDDVQARQVQQLYAGYLRGLSRAKAAREAGLVLANSSVKAMLQNRRYLGDTFYPAIIDQSTFDQAQAERLQRQRSRAQTEKPDRPKKQPPMKFRLEVSKKHFSDPYEQAQYLYSLIGEEENVHEE